MQRLGDDIPPAWSWTAGERASAAPSHSASGQRLGIAMAVVHRPDVPVLDEPGNGLDPLGVVMGRELLPRAAAERGAAVLVTRHLDEVARTGDRGLDEADWRSSCSGGRRSRHPIQG